jgi:hypothetical protein
MIPACQNAENSTQPPLTRREWKYAKIAAAFNARHGFRFAPDYLTMLEREMRDPSLAAWLRLIAAPAPPPAARPNYTMGGGHVRGLSPASNSWRRSTISAQ